VLVQASVAESFLQESGSCIVISDIAILSVKMSGSDPSSHLFYDVLRPNKILSTDCGVLIVDKICLGIPNPCQFPDVPVCLHTHYLLALPTCHHLDLAIHLHSHSKYLSVVQQQTDFALLPAGVSTFSPIVFVQSS
jgi:hypothetical protein